MCAPNTKKEHRLKIVVAGDGGVGKTCLLNRYISNTFMDVMKITIGTGFFAKEIEMEDFIAKLQLWDFGGEKRFRFLLPNYCKGAHGVILAFDMNDFTTLMNLDEWLQIVRENTKDPVIILVGTKVDVAGYMDERIIQDFCKENAIKKFIPTSAKTRKNIELVFQELVENIIDKSKKF